MTDTERAYYGRPLPELLERLDALLLTDDDVEWDHEACDLLPAIADAVGLRGRYVAALPSGGAAPTEEAHVAIGACLAALMGGGNRDYHEASDLFTKAADARAAVAPAGERERALEEAAQACERRADRMRERAKKVDPAAVAQIRENAEWVQGCADTIRALARRAEGGTDG